MKIIGENKRSFLAESGAWVDTTVVLVEEGVQNYAAYIGVGSPEYVAKHGNKISFQEACVHFPFGLVKEKYRE